MTEGTCRKRTGEHNTTNPFQKKCQNDVAPLRGVELEGRRHCHGGAQGSFLGYINFFWPMDPPSSRPQSNGLSLSFFQHTNFIW